jgi:cell division protein YceG involved in septum cleavage
MRNSFGGKLMIDSIFGNYVMQMEMEEEDLIGRLQAAETDEEIISIVEEARNTFTTDVINEVLRKLQIAI